MSSCPLVTSYTEQTGVPAELLEKLFAIRNWDVDAVKEGKLPSVPFNWPASLRKEITHKGKQVPLVLREYQRQMIVHLTRMPRFICGDAVGLGKAQPLTAKVLTPTGWKMMGELQLGDAVVDPDGGIGYVEGIFPQGEKPIFRLLTNDGGTTESCGEHLWTVQTIEDRQQGKFRTLSTQQLLEKGLFEISGPEGWRRNRFFLPVSSPVIFTNPAQLPIKPYSLGLLLGDGTFREPGIAISCAEVECLEKFRQELPEGLSLRQCGVTCDYGVTSGSRQSPNAYIRASKTLGLYNKLSFEKHIPEGYLKASVSERTELLQGLLDSDGECSKAGLVYFGTTSRALAEGVVELVRSLGGMARLKPCRGKFYTHNGERRQGRPGFDVTIKTTFNPFFLTRKAQRWKTQMFARAIVAIEPVQAQVAQCIRVSTKRHLYITDDYIVTHNTLDTIAASCWLKEKLPHLKFIVLATKSTTFQWKSEYEKFSTLRPFVMVDEYRGQKSYAARLQQVRDFLKGDKKDVLVCKYTSLLGKRKKLDGQFDQDGNPVQGGMERVSQEIKEFCEILKEHGENIVLVLDECQKFKTLGTQIRNLVALSSRPVKRVWALSATAIKNSLDEFYSISCAIGVRPVGSMSDFYENVCIFKKQYVGRGIHKRVLVGYVPAKAKEFKAAMRPFFLGRSQKQVKEPLPNLSTAYHPVDLNEEQTKLLLHDIPSGKFVLPLSVVKVAGEIVVKERDPNNMMTMMAVYQAVANHPCLLDPSDKKKFFTPKLSPKEEALLDLIDGEYRGEKCIVFTKFRTWIDRLEQITANGHFTERKFLRITGAESEKKREEAKKLFQETDDHDLIVINSAAMEGVNLQSAAHMFLLDCPWSWGDLIQLVGRMVRMASEHSACTLHVLTAKGTIDEYTIETLKGKKGIFEIILGESHSAGILDDGAAVDLSSGMEEAGSDDEFRRLLQAHMKPVALKTFIGGEQLQAAQEDDYKMLHERESSGKRKKADDPFDKYNSKWGF